LGAVKNELIIINIDCSDFSCGSLGISARKKQVKPSKQSIILLLTFLLSINLFGQLKYVGENRGAVIFSGSFGKMRSSNFFGGQFNYSTNGKVGVGISYIHLEAHPGGDGFGFQIESAILRPKSEIGVGINLIGSFTATWAHTTYSTPFIDGFHGLRYSVHETTVRSKSFAVGGELYLHTREKNFRVEPFLQIARIFSTVTATNLSESYSGNSIGFGTDLITKVSETNLIVIIPGIVFQGHALPSLMGTISFCHTIK